MHLVRTDATVWRLSLFENVQLLSLRLPRSLHGCLLYLLSVSLASPSSFLCLPSQPFSFPFLFLSASSLSPIAFQIFWHISFTLRPLSTPVPLASPLSPLCHLFALVSFLLHCHQLLCTEQRVITFVLQRVSLIGFMPLSSATSAEKQIEAFCHI